MKNYIIAIIHTLLLVISPIIFMPFIQWWKKEFLDPETAINVIFVGFVLIWLMLFGITIYRWRVAFRNDPETRGIGLLS